MFHTCPGLNIPCRIGSRANNALCSDIFDPFKNARVLANRTNSYSATTMKDRILNQDVCRISFGRYVVIPTGDGPISKGDAVRIECVTAVGILGRALLLTLSAPS